MNNSGGAAPTGCYKCGRPGHWSRDCPSDPTTTTTTTPHGNNDSNPDLQPESRPPLSTQKPKQKAPRRSRPKLTPDLLLSDAGIGHILRYFPKAFKCRGRGHEVNKSDEKEYVKARARKLEEPKVPIAEVGDFSFDLGGYSMAFVSVFFSGNVEISFLHAENQAQKMRLKPQDRLTFLQFQATEHSLKQDMDTRPMQSVMLYTFFGWVEFMY